MIIFLEKTPRSRGIMKVAGNFVISFERKRKFLSYEAYMSYKCTQGQSL